MRATVALCLVLVAGSAALAVDLSGEWTAQLAFTSGAVSPSATFTLRLSGPGWKLTTSWDPARFDATRHTFVLKTGFGPLGVTAGGAFSLSTRAALARGGPHEGLWSVDGFSFRGGFVSFDLVLGSLTLRLTFHGGPEE